MTVLEPSRKACAVNPLKLSPALGAALAFLGIERSLPLFHGSQGCTAFALVLMVRHFREAIPLQTTAMSELTTILGGADNIEKAIGTILDRARPRLIGLCSTALTETSGEDIRADLRLMRQRHPEWRDLAVVYAATPDFAGSLEEGWGRAVAAIIEELVPCGPRRRVPRQVNLLPGCHLTPADVEELIDLIESFGLQAVVLPDLSKSLDGHVPAEHVATSCGGTPVDRVPALAASIMTLAIGEHMRDAAEALRLRAEVPYRLFPRVHGLAATDALVELLLKVSGRPAPERVKRDRSRLVDAMLDAHFSLTAQRVALAGEADLVASFAQFLADTGAIIEVTVSATDTLANRSIPATRRWVGDLEDWEQAASDCDLLVANAHAAEIAKRLDKPLYRLGFPQFDRLGGWARVTVGYRGARQTLFDLANLLIDAQPHPHPPSDCAASLAGEEVAHAETACC